jgi:hypothetical protein
MAAELESLDDNIFKDFAIIDLSQVRTRKLGMRWRSREDVLKGKGEYICGAVGCHATELTALEIPFAHHTAAGEISSKQFVTVHVCNPCGALVQFINRAPPILEMDSAVSESDPEQRHRHSRHYGHRR